VSRREDIDSGATHRFDHAIRHGAVPKLAGAAAQTHTTAQISHGAASNYISVERASEGEYADGTSVVGSGKRASIDGIPIALAAAGGNDVDAREEGLGHGTFPNDIAAALAANRVELHRLIAGTGDPAVLYRDIPQRRTGPAVDVNANVRGASGERESIQIQRDVLLYDSDGGPRRVDIAGEVVGACYAQHDLVGDDASFDRRPRLDLRHCFHRRRGRRHRYGT